MSKHVTLSNYTEDQYYPKVVRAVAERLKVSRAVSMVEVFLGMGLLSNKDLRNWSIGQVPYLERVINCNLGKAERVIRILGFHAHDLNLGKSHNFVKHKGKVLQFSKSGAKKLEERYSYQYSIIGKNNPFSDNTDEQKR